MDFSLLIHQNNLLLKNADYTLDTDILGLGLQAIDIPANLPIEIGFGGGYAFVDQQTVPGLNNASMGGLYFTFMARTALFTTKSWSSEVVFAYDYLRVQKNSETQNSRLHWNHFTAEASLNYYLTPYLSIRLGAIAGLLDAKLTGSGENNTSADLNTDEQIAASVGINYHVTDQQKLAVMIQQGYYDRLVIQFQRTFY
ncbi:hypothetical protein [Kaarinaea lacus]